MFIHSAPSRLDAQPVRPKRAPRAPRPRRADRPRIGELLVNAGVVSHVDLLRMVALRPHEDVPIGQILLAQGHISEADLYDALARQFGCARLDLAANPPDTRLIDAVGPETCLQGGFVPWRRVGAATVVATAHPERFATLEQEIRHLIPTAMMAVATETDIQNAVLRARRLRLAQGAETLVPKHESCRDFRPRRARALFAIAFVALALAVALAPGTTLAAVSGLAVVVLVANTSLKLAAALACLLRRPRRAPPPHISPHGLRQWPQVSLLVPLFREPRVVGRLVRNLGRIDYPRELLDVRLIVEEGDSATARALARESLPPGFRTVVVPHGTFKTKPRALNFALKTCRGSVVGIYDAEDEPDRGQVRAAARRFLESGPELACLQARLGFYNPRENWISRCFTIEYAAWFRVLLPGLQALGLVVPLGGTSVFFRRQALEDVGGWDAHNVTEDADLGVRLARHGYRTEMLDSETREEANHRLWPWVRQRSRWLKGYAMTWAVHSRAPGRLLADVGLRRVLGLQLLFLGSLLNFALAPVLLSFWAIPLGLPHPLAQALPPGATGALSGLFLGSEAVSIAINLFALQRGERWLAPWTTTMNFYFMLGTAAVAKAMSELARSPFFWDKTDHGTGRPCARRRAAG